MNFLVTAGPTYESLDRVRRLTNFSTGRLGTGLANYLSTQGHDVVLLRGHYATCGGEPNADKVITFTTTADLEEKLQSLVGWPPHAVYHAAAVSDFRFGKVFQRLPSGEVTELQAGKFSTRQGTLLAELIPTPKIITRLRSWFPKAYLVGWKFEVDGTHADALQAGRDQIQRCQTDACVVNGPAYGDGFGLLSRGTACEHVPDAPGLFEVLAKRRGNINIELAS